MVPQQSFEIRKVIFNYALLSGGLNNVNPCQKDKPRTTFAKRTKVLDQMKFEIKQSVPKSFAQIL